MSEYKGSIPASRKRHRGGEFSNMNEAMYMFRAICKFAQFRNLRNFEIALCKLEIAKLETNFEIAWPTSLCNLEIAQPSSRDFEIALRKLEIAKLRSVISRVNVYS